MIQSNWTDSNWYTIMLRIAVSWLVSNGVSHKLNIWFNQKSCLSERNWVGKRESMKFSTLLSVFFFCFLNLANLSAPRKTATASIKKQTETTVDALTTTHSTRQYIHVFYCTYTMYNAVRKPNQKLISHEKWTKSTLCEALKHTHSHNANRDLCSDKPNRTACTYWIWLIFHFIFFASLRSNQMTIYAKIEMCECVCSCVVFT